MKLFLLSTTLLLLPIGAGMALSKPLSAPIEVNSASASSIAQLPPFSPPPPPTGEMPPAPPWAKDINLSTEQKQRIATIHEQARQDIDKLHQQLFAADSQMRSLLESNASSEQLRQQHQRIQQMHQQLDNKHFETMLAERQVLTPEQLAQLSQMSQQRQQAPLPQKRSSMRNKPISE